MVPKDMLKSSAWLSLSNIAKVAWLHLAADFNGKEQKRTSLRLPYSQAEKLMTRKSYSKALTELQAKGFIRKTKHGGLEKNCSEYELIYEWRKWTPKDE